MAILMCTSSSFLQIFAGTRCFFSFLDHSFSLLWNKFDFNCHCFFVLGGVAHGVLIASILQPHLLAYVLRASPGSWR
jgi:hypothetical protein